MNRLFGLLLTSCALALASTGVIAETAAAGATAKLPHLADCNKAGGKKAECEGYNKAMLACVKAAEPVAHRECMEDHMPAPDCAKAPEPARCATVLAGREACKGKYGPERAKCMKDKVPAATQGSKKS
jgi:hypothetical protein